MIVIKLNGGLGNQMFQYAAAKALAVKLNVELKADISFFRIPANDKWTQRSYELDVFAGNKAIISEKELVPFLKVKNAKRPIRTVFNTFGKYKCFFEPSFNYTPALLQQKDNTYIEGYFQSEKYFKEIESIIHDEFTFRDISSPVNQELAQNISGTNSVSIHVRRNDYTNPKELQHHGLCDIKYYQKAVAFLSEQMKDIHLFIFSDDMEWVKQNLIFPYPAVYISHNKGKESVEDMRLMSLCKHNIIANSSFSWWAAWLNHNPKKITIAPRNWFTNLEMNTDDLIPCEWKQM